MKREVILLRHAHAETGQPGQADADRVLSPRGVDEASAAGRWLRDKSALQEMQEEHAANAAADAALNNAQGAELEREESDDQSKGTRQLRNNHKLTSDS